MIQPASAHEAETAQTTAKPSSTRVVQPSTVREETGERANPDTGEIPVVQKPDGRLSADPNDPDVAKAIRDEQVEQKKATRTKKRRNKLAVIITCILAVLALAGAGWGAYTWSQTHYYVGDSNGTVAIYRGVPTNLFGLELSHEVQTTNIATADLPQTWRDQLSQGITVGSLDEAQSHVGIIRTEMRKLAKQQEADAAKKAEASNSRTVPKTAPRAIPRTAPRIRPASPAPRQTSPVRQAHPIPRINPVSERPTTRPREILNDRYPSTSDFFVADCHGNQCVGVHPDVPAHRRRILCNTPACWHWP